MTTIITFLIIFAVAMAIFLIPNKKTKATEKDTVASDKNRNIGYSSFKSRVEPTLSSTKKIKKDTTTSSKASTPIRKIAKKEKIEPRGIKAKIKGRETYGLFVELPSGVSGLLHKSNLHKGRHVSNYLYQDTIFVEEIPPNQLGKHSFKAVGALPKTQKQFKEEIVASSHKKIFYIKAHRNKEITCYIALNKKYIVLAGILCERYNEYGSEYRGKGVILNLYANSIYLEESPLNIDYIYTKEGLIEQDTYDRRAAQETKRIDELKKRLFDFKKTYNTTKPTPIFSGDIKCTFSGRDTKDHKPEGKYDAKPIINVKIYGDIFSVDGDFYIVGYDSGKYSYSKEEYRNGLGSINFKDGKNYASYNLEKPEKIQRTVPPVEVRNVEPAQGFEIRNGEAYTSPQSNYGVKEEYLSTSNLGREIGVTPKEFIAYFIEKGLLKRVGKSLVLTDLGGQYGGAHNSRGNESWVVWPKSILKKSIIANFHNTKVVPQKPKISFALEDKISHFGFYHPYNHGNNPEFDIFSGRILDFKKDQTAAVGYFFEQLKNVDFNATEAVVIVPSHSPQNRMSSVRKLAQKLAQYKGWTDATDCVVRTHLIDKLANGGERSMDVHLGSLKIMNPHLIAGKNVLVLDDVTTSGNSLFATMRLLKEKNVNSVWSYAIAKTN